MKKIKWGLRFTELLGYIGIGYVLSKYGIHGWDIFFVILSIDLIQWFVNFVKEVIDY